LILTPEKLRFYRYNPEIAAEDLLKVKLIWYQRNMLKTAWNTPFTIWFCSRGAAKTFMAALFLSLKSIFYRNVKCGVYAGDYTQTEETFTKLSMLYDGSDFLREVATEPRWAKGSKGVMKFSTGSAIIASPMKRGPRRNILFIDEYREVDPEKERTILQPMLIVKHPEIMNQTLAVSSGAYEGNPFSIMVNEFEERIKEGNKDFAVCKFDVYDALTGPYMDKKQLEIAKARLLDEEFRMEFLCEIVSHKDSWITAPMIRACERKYKPEYKGDSNYEYFIGGDIARVKGGDNSSFVVLKIIPGVGVQLAKVIAMNGVPFNEQAMELRKLIKDFSPIMVVMDWEKASMAIADFLKLPSVDPRDGEYLPPILPIEGEDTADLETDAETKNALRLIKPIRFANIENIWQRGIMIKKAIQNQKLLFPEDDYQIYVPDDELDTLSEEERKQLKLYNEVSALKKEICNIRVKANETQTSFSFYSPKTKKDKDDRFTALLMGASEALIYYEEMMGTEEDAVALWG